MGVPWALWPTKIAIIAKDPDLYIDSMDRARVSVSNSDRRLQRILREAVSIPVQASDAFNYEQARDELNLEHNITPNEARTLCSRSIIGKVSFVREI